MRQILAPVLTTILFFSPLVGAQQQEKKLLDRINRPNMELTNPMQGKAFSGGGGVQMRDAVVKSAVFDSSKSAYLKEFSGARSFLGIKTHGSVTGFLKPKARRLRARRWWIRLTRSVKPQPEDSLARASARRPLRRVSRVVLFFFKAVRRVDSNKSPTRFRRR